MERVEPEPLSGREPSGSLALKIDAAPRRFNGAPACRIEGYHRTAGGPLLFQRHGPERISLPAARARRCCSQAVRPAPRGSALDPIFEIASGKAVPA